MSVIKKQKLDPEVEEKHQKLLEKKKTFQCLGCMQVIAPDLLSAGNPRLHFTQRHIYHIECWENRDAKQKAVANGQVCVSCGGNVCSVNDKDPNVVNTGKRLWHKKCYDASFINSEQGALVNVVKAGLCPGCNAEVSLDDPDVHVTKGNRLWCKKCWKDSVEFGGRFTPSTKMKASLHL